MLKATPEYFSTDDVAEIKNWLSQKGAALFRKALQQEAVARQIEGSNEALKGIDPERKRFNADAESHLQRVRDLNMVITEMDKAAGKDFKPFVAKVITA